jgi:hypothetical protein
MTTKEELKAFRNETAENFRALRLEVAEIRRDLEALKEHVGHMSGYSKEIDHLMERVRAIEKHIGIEPRVAA